MTVFGNILNETSALADAPEPGQFGFFDKSILFETTDDLGTLQVFQYSAKDGSEIDMVELPVVFKDY